MASDSGISEDISPVSPNLFPTEVICRIIDCHDFRYGPTRVSYDPTLFSWALVNHTFSHWARSIIFGTVVLTYTRTAQDLGCLLRANPALGSLVRTLAFEYSAQIFVPPRHASPGITDMLPWRYFSELRTLRFHTIQPMPSIASLRDILDTMPKLEFFELSEAGFADYEHYSPSHDVHPSASSPGPTPFRCPNLKSFIASSTTIYPSECAPLLLGSPTPDPGNIAPLETLLLDNLWNLPRVEDYFAWTPLIRAWSKTLRKIELWVFSTPPQSSLRPAGETDDSSPYPARLFSALAECNALRSIELQCCFNARLERPVPTYMRAAETEPGLREVFDALCTHLACAPHPELEELKLTKYEGGSDPFSDAACAQFADALLGPRMEQGDREWARPCPRFRRLALVLRSGLPPLNAFCISEIEMYKPEMVEKWRKAFGRFEEKGIELTVKSVF